MKDDSDNFLFHFVIEIHQFLSRSCRKVPALAVMCLGEGMIFDANDGVQTLRLVATVDTLVSYLLLHRCNV